MNPYTIHRTPLGGVVTLPDGRTVPRIIHLSDSGLTFKQIAAEIGAPVDMVRARMAFLRGHAAGQAGHPLEGLSMRARRGLLLFGITTRAQAREAVLSGFLRAGRKAGYGPRMHEVVCDWLDFTSMAERPRFRGKSYCIVRTFSVIEPRQPRVGAYMEFIAQHATRSGWRTMPVQGTLTELIEDEALGEPMVLFIPEASTHELHDAELTLIPARLLRIGTSIECPVCHRVSHHPEDIRQRYCGRCHAFHDDLHPHEKKTAQASA